MRLSSDRTSFMRSIKQVAELLQDNVAAFKNSIGLVATKADSIKSDKQLVMSVNAFLVETIESLKIKLKEVEDRGEHSAVTALQRQIQLVQFLADGDKVAIFRRPDDLQSPWTLPPLRKNFEQIRDLLFNKLDNLDTINQQYHVSVAPETVIYIKDERLGPVEEKLKGIFEKVASFLVTDFDVNVSDLSFPEELEMRMEYGQHYLEEISQIKASTTLIDFFKAHAVDSSLGKEADLEIRNFLFLHKVVGSDMDRLETEISDMLGLREKVQKHIEQTVNFNSFATFFDPAERQLRGLLQQQAFPSRSDLQIIQPIHVSLAGMWNRV